jgi:FixJ family two-component response regulator
VTSGFHEKWESGSSPTELETVVVLDDDLSVLRGLVRLLKSVGYTVRAFESPKQLLDSGPWEAPDAGIPGRAACIVTDLRMPELNGLELQEALARRGSRVPIIFITGHGDVPSSVRAMKAGAVDFLQKPFDENDLLDAVSRALARDHAARQEWSELAEVRSKFEELTPREREVALLVAQGLLNKQIADELGMAERTVKVHRSRVMEKLAVESVADLVRLCDRARLMAPTT